MRIIILLLAASHFFHGHVLCKNTTGNQLTVIDDIGGKNALPESFTQWQFVKFLKDVTACYFTRNIQPSSEWNSQFGYPIRFEAILSLIVITNQTTTLRPLGKWNVGLNDALHSGYRTLEMSAEKPIELAPNCYQFKLHIYRMTLNIAYLNNVTFKVIARIEEGAKNNISSKISEASYTFLIPYVLSINDLLKTSMMCVMFLIWLAVTVILKIMALIYGKCTFVFDISLFWNMLPMRLARRLTYILFNCLIMTLILMLLSQVIMEVFGSNLLIIRRSTYIFVLVLTVTSLYKDTLLQLQLSLICIYETWYKFIISILLLYLIIIILLKLIPAGYEYVRLSPCIVKKAAKAFNEGILSETKRLANLVEATKRIKSNEPIEESSDPLSGNEELASLIDIFGGDEDQAYTSEEIEEMGKVFKGDQKEACLNMIAKQKDFCQSVKVMLRRTCFQEYDKEVAQMNWFKSALANYMEFKHLCKKPDKQYNCAEIMKEVDSDFCERKDEANGSKKGFGKAFDKDPQKASFQDLTYNVNFDSISEMKMLLPLLADSIFNGIVGTISSYMYTCFTMIGFFIFFRSCVNNVHYLEMYRKVLKFDNYCIGRAFKIYDQEQVKKGRLPLLPLTKEEIKSLKTESLLMRRKKQVAIKVFVFVLGMWFLMQKCSQAIIANNNKLAALDITVATLSYKFDMSVHGSGSMADNFRMIREIMKFEGMKAFKANISSCFPKPMIIPHATFAFVVFFLLVGLLEDRLQLLSQWRPFVTGIFYPDTAKARTKNLYFNLKRKRRAKENQPD